MSVAKATNQGLIDTIGAGYQALNRRPWVIGIPAVFSAYLWLGPQVRLAEGSEIAGGLRAALGAAGGGSALQEQLVADLIGGDLRFVLAWLNLMPLLSPGPAAGGPAGPILGGALPLLGAAALINLLALLGSSLFLGLLGDAVAGVRRGLLGSLGLAGRLAARVGLALLACLGVGLVLAMPFLALSAIVVAALPGLAPAVLLGWYIALFWAYVYAGFTPEAILISEARPLRALYHSVNLVRRNLGATVGLLLLSYIVLRGTELLWRGLADSPLGLAAALLGSAYIGSGLAAARLEFYKSRR